MTPKEKAQELIKRFEDGLTVKDCALIAIDEIIEQHEGSVDFLWSEIGYLMAPPVFWQQVKHEIEKI